MPPDLGPKVFRPREDPGTGALVARGVSSVRVLLAVRWAHHALEDGVELFLFLLARSGLGTAPSLSGPESARGRPPAPTSLGAAHQSG
jgi:hypothetical protein